MKKEYRRLLKWITIFNRNGNKEKKKTLATCWENRLPLERNGSPRLDILLAVCGLFDCTLMDLLNSAPGLIPAVVSTTTAENIK